MNILIVSQYYSPERFLINQIAEKLVEHGHSVSVFTGLPNYPCGIIPEEYKRGKRRSEMINGVKIYRCAIIPRGKSHFTLGLNYLSFAINGMINILKIQNEFDVVYVYQMTPITMVLPALKFARKKRINVYCYCLDLAPASGGLIAKKFPILYKLYFRISNYIYNKCNIIGVTSKSFIEYLEAVHGISRDNIAYLPQHASEEMSYLNLKKKENDSIDFMFAGNLGNGAKLETILYAAKELYDSGYMFKVHFVGEGRAKPELIALTTELSLQEVIVFHDAVNMLDMPEKYRMADALIVTLRKGQVTIPGKLQAYMSTGKPIIGAMDGSGNELINESKCGKCAEAEDSHGLAHIMRDYIDNKNIYSEYGINGRNYFFEHFTLEKHMMILENSLESLIKRG